MSAKLLADQKVALARAVEWPAVGTDGTACAASDPEPPPAPPPPEPSVSVAPAPPDLSHVVAAQQHRIHDLEQEMVRRARESFQQGHNAGTAEAQQQVTEQYRPVMERLAKAIEDITGLRRKVRAEAEEDAVKLALAVARKVLHREVTVDREALLGLVKAAMRRIDSRELHRIRMHPDDIAHLQHNLTAIGMPPQVEVLADVTLERGGVILETQRGSLDASVSTQLAEIERGFVDLLKHSREGN